MSNDWCVETPMLQICVVATLTSVIANEYSIGCSFATDDVCFEYWNSLIVSCVSSWRVVLPKFSKGGDYCSFWIGCIIKNNMKYVQVVSCAEEINVEHVIPTCVLQLWSLTTDKCYCSFGSDLFNPRFTLQRRFIIQEES